MLASDPAGILNQNRTDLGIPNRFNPKESDSSAPAPNTGKQSSPTGGVWVDYQSHREKNRQNDSDEDKIVQIIPSHTPHCSNAGRIGR
jgi:hypothetical protein